LHFLTDRGCRFSHRTCQPLPQQKEKPDASAYDR
jgi:hypothetical protein